MLKKIFFPAVALATYACASIYPTAGVVMWADAETAIVRTVNGCEYDISNVGCDYYPGDAVALIMHDNATPVITDDVPLIVRYIGGVDCLQEVTK